MNSLICGGEPALRRGLGQAPAGLVRFVAAVSTAGAGCLERQVLSGSTKILTRTEKKWKNGANPVWSDPITHRESSRQEFGQHVDYRFCRNQASAGPLPIEIGPAQAWSSCPNSLLPKIQAGPARFLYALPRQSLGQAFARSRCPKPKLVRASTYRFFEDRRLLTPALLASGVGPCFPKAARIDFAPAERFRTVADSARAVGIAFRTAYVTLGHKYGNVFRSS
jgi:hypothetical protein